MTTKDPNCFYCRDDQRRKDLMIEIMKLKSSTLYLFRDQKNRGRCVLKFNDHKVDLSQLTDDEYRLFSNELRMVSKTLMTLFHPDKINYAIYGDLVPHLHVHIVPKRKDGPQWGAPFSDSVPQKILSDEEYRSLVSEIREELTRQLSNA
ncbi:MAG: HIT family protein [Succinatimonas hippei]|nr:HIT family protein [Succinatimonas hippei]